MSKIDEKNPGERSSLINKIDKKKRFFTSDKELLIDLGILLFLVVFIRFFLVTPYRVQGPSMCDTINNVDGRCLTNADAAGELIIIDKVSYRFREPNRGDVVVFHPPDLKSANLLAEESYIKRIIGVPGDTVELKEGKIFIYNEQNRDGFELNEPYLNDVNRNNTQPDHFALKKFEVPAGKYFVLGDNRQASTDSRTCFGIKDTVKRCDERAYLTLDHIVGRAWVTILPFSNIKVIEHGNN